MPSLRVSLLLTTFAAVFTAATPAFSAEQQHDLRISWEGETTIGHQTELVSASEDGKRIRLRRTLSDG